MNLTSSNKIQCRKNLWIKNIGDKSTSYSPIHCISFIILYVSLTPRSSPFIIPTYLFTEEIILTTSHKFFISNFKINLIDLKNTKLISKFKLQKRLCEIYSFTIIFFITAKKSNFCVNWVGIVHRSPLEPRGLSAVSKTHKFRATNT